MGCYRDDAATIIDREGSRLDMVIVPLTQIENILVLASQYPHVVGPAKGMSSYSQRTQYIRVLNAIGFYNWNFKSYLDKNWRFVHSSETVSIEQR